MNLAFTINLRYNTWKKSWISLNSVAWVKIFYDVIRLSNQV